MAGLCLTGAVSNNQSKLESAQRAKYVLTGAAQLATADLESGVLLPGASKTYYIGGNSVTVTAATNPALANSATLTVSGSSGSLPISTVTNVSYLPVAVDNCWSYGIFSNGGFTWPLLGSNKVTGSVYFRNTISILGLGGQVTKDYKSSSSFNPLSLLSIGGAILTGINPMSFPTVSSTTYTGAANSVLTGNQTLNGYTFPTANALVVVNGTLTIHGTISGDGTIYATGGVTVDANLSRQAGSHHIMIVTPGTITFRSSSGGSLSADGYYFAGTQISIQSTLTTTGGLVGNSYSVSSGFNITNDPWLNSAQGNGALMHAPGLWP